MTATRADKAQARNRSTGCADSRPARGLLKRFLLISVVPLLLGLLGAAPGHADFRPPAEPPYLFNSGVPATNPYDTCGDCYAWSSTYHNSPTEFDLTARRFTVPSGAYTHAIRMWWSYGDEGPYDPIRNHGGTAADFTGIVLDLYEVEDDGAPGDLIATLEGEWITLNAQNHYKEYQLTTPHFFSGSDYFLSLRANTPHIGYDAVVLWHACAPGDDAIDYLNAHNTVWSSGGWDPYTEDNRPYSPCPQDMDFGLQVLGFLVPDGVDAVPANPCVTGDCVTVAINWNRLDSVPVRGYSIKFELSENLRLCVGDPDNIRESNYLGRIGETSFQTVDHGDGTYTVDCAILGLPCGATGTGTLFTIKVEPDGPYPEGPASVAILSAIARDCDNGPVPIVPGNPASMLVDTIPPDEVTDLTATQIKAGNNPPPPNPPRDVTGIEIAFTLPADAEVVEIYRAPFGNYPLYDSGSNPGSEPPAFSYPPPAPWTRLTGVTGSPHVDRPQTRNFWYYVVYSKDACGNVSAVSNRTDGTLNYHLGDVSKGMPPLCSGNNIVFIEDLSLLGDRYGLTNADPDFLPCVDVGPTTDGTVDARPTPDGLIDFEDLMVFATNFNQVGFAPPGPSVQPQVSGPPPRLVLRSRPAAARGEWWAELVLEDGSGVVKGSHAHISFDPQSAGLLAVDKGGLVESVGSGAAFFTIERPGSLVVDLAMLGREAVLPENGTIALLRFRIPTGVQPADPEPASLEGFLLRDSRNRTLACHPDGDGGCTDGGSNGGQSPADPQAEDRSESNDSRAGMLSLHARPNPFSNTAEIRLNLPGPDHIRVAVYDVSGRRIRGLAAGEYQAGEHTWIWDGRDDHGRPAAAGVYLCTVHAGDAVHTLKLQRNQ